MPLRPSGEQDRKPDDALFELGKHPRREGALAVLVTPARGDDEREVPAQLHETPIDLLVDRQDGGMAHNQQAAAPPGWHPLGLQRRRLWFMIACPGARAAVFRKAPCLTPRTEPRHRPAREPERAVEIRDRQAERPASRDRIAQTHELGRRRELPEQERRFRANSTLASEEEEAPRGRRRRQQAQRLPFAEHRRCGAELIEKLAAA